MQQYLYEDQYRGKLRKLVIFSPQKGNEYRVFFDGGFIGVIKRFADTGPNSTWKTDYSILKPIVLQIGKSIEVDFHTSP